MAHEAWGSRLTFLLTFRSVVSWPNPIKHFALFSQSTHFCILFFVCCWFLSEHLLLLSSPPLLPAGLLFTRSSFSIHSLSLLTRISDVFLVSALNLSHHSVPCLTEDFFIPVFLCVYVKRHFNLSSEVIFILKWTWIDVCPVQYIKPLTYTWTKTHFTSGGHWPFVDPPLTSDLSNPIMIDLCNMTDYMQTDEIRLERSP